MSRAHPAFHRSNPLPPVVDSGTLFRLQIFARLLAQEVVTTFYYHNDLNREALTDPETDLVTAWRDLFQAPWLDQCSSEYAIYQFKVTDMRANAIAPVYVVPTSALPGHIEYVSGTPGTRPLPPQNAGVITRLTKLRGQHGRGRLYFPGLTVGQTDEGQLTEAAKTALSDAVGLKIPEVLSGGGIDSAWAPYLVKVPSVADATLRGQIIVNTRTNRHIGTIRRRGLGVGA